MNKLVAFVGFKGCGKDTAANVLMDEFGYSPIAFADSIKDCLSSIFVWDRSKLEGDTPESRRWREDVDPWWANALGIPNFTPRWAMTNFGTDIMRAHFDSSIWIKNTQRRLIGCDKAVIKDGRFPNEIEMIRQGGGQTVRIRRGPEPHWWNIALQANMGDDDALLSMKELGVHESEWAWIGQEFDYEIPNDGSICDLHSIVRKFVAQ